MVAKLSHAKSSFGFILDSNDVLPQGKSQGKIFLTLNPLGGTGVKTPFWGQIEPKCKSGHSFVKYYPISMTFIWITHSYKGFPKLL